MPSAVRCFLLLPCALALAVLSTGQDKPTTGPETEKRFPPLKVPPGFKATLFACDPFIEYPSAICAGPRPRSLFVAVDYMTGLGLDHVRRDEIRLIEDTDGDGYADKSTVYAKGFHSIMGLAWHDGALYVMHAPYLTVIRDTKGTGVGDQHTDLLSGLGLTPQDNPVLLHCANGVVMGHDGWLYLALGDHGCDVMRPEGDRLLLEGGGILRCRPDGSDLHVFSTGLRNIYDVALDADLNVFVRDNENDGGTYMIRVCHSFLGADHGYPYHYYERPREALPPLADLGLGSSAGGVSYQEQAFPADYRGNLFFCEWGRSVVRYPVKPEGSGFGPVKEIEFAAAAENDPYGFKPTDLVVQSDGALFVADWADGQRPKRGRGRIYRITAGEEAKPAPRPEGIEANVKALDAESMHQRIAAQTFIEHQGDQGMKALRQALADKKFGVLGRLHAVWLLARARAVDELFNLAKSDPEPRVRAQAVRAIGDLADPILVKHWLDAGPGEVAIAIRLAALAKGEDPRVQREAIIALGRLRWTETPSWLVRHVKMPDAAMAQAAMQSLRSVGNWNDVLPLVDRPSDDPVRGIALRAVSGQYDPALVDRLIARLRGETEASRRIEYADALARVHRKPASWVYWGYRPPPRPANTQDWERTDAIAAALDRTLADADRGVRLAVLRRMQREKIPARVKTLAARLRDDLDAELVDLIIDSFRDSPRDDTRAPLQGIVQEKKHTAANRQKALTLLAAGLDAASAGVLLDLGMTVEAGPLLAEVLRQTARHPKLAATPLLLNHVDSMAPEVRAAAVETLAECEAAEGKEPALKLLDDQVPEVRRAAAAAAGKLKVAAAAETLLKRAADENASVRSASLIALRQIGEPRAVPHAIKALDDRETQLAALDCLGDLGGPEQLNAVVGLARRAATPQVLTDAVRVLTTWANRDGVPPAKRKELDLAVAEVQGTTGTLVRWVIRGPVPAGDAAKVIERFAPVPVEAQAPEPGWRSVLSSGTEARVDLARLKGDDGKGVCFAYSDLVMPEAAAVEFLASAGGRLQIWLNGKSLHKRAESSPYRPGSDRFKGDLVKGPNRLLVQVASPGATVEFHLQFRRKSASADHERLTQAALARSGNAERGSKVFFDTEKSQCIKCHRIGDRGERIGPELTGIGARFGRVYLVESILEPNRTVVPGFNTLLLALKDGKVLNGVKVTETDTTLTLADNTGKKHEIKKADIEEQQTLATSTMPEGLEKKLTEQEFIDLIAYLVSLKDRGR